MTLLNRLRLMVVWLLTAVALASCSNAPKGQPAAAMGTAAHELSVHIEDVVTKEVSDATSYLGTARSRHSSTLQPLVNGTITKIFVKPGDLVQEGQPLIEINPEKQKATVNSSLAFNESTRADQENAVHTLQALQASLLAKQANLAFARSEEKRYALLAPDGAVSMEQAESYSNQRKIAEADIQTVDAQIEAQKSLMEKLKGVEKQTDASAREQQVQLQYFTIRAPFAGIVGDIPAKIGEYANSDTKLTTVTENQPLEIYIWVPAEKAPELRLGMAVQLMDSEEKLIGEAQVIFISPNVEDASQSVLVKALYSNPQGKLRSNQSVDTRVVWKKQPGLLVPTFAVAHISGQDFVFTAERSKTGNLIARQKPIEPGPIHGQMYEVKTGLAAGDRIVVSGIQNLVDGAPISALTATSGR